MDSVETYRQAIEQILSSHAAIPYAYGDVQTETVFDREHDRYLLVNVGWENGRRVHGTLVHVDIRDGKIWIQRDGTESGIATELVEMGVPKQLIVLAFRPPEIRELSEFAVV